MQPRLGMRPNLPATYFGANNLLESAIFDLMLLLIILYTLTAIIEIGPMLNVSLLTNNDVSSK